MTVATGNHHTVPSSEIRRMPAIAAIRGPTKGNLWLVRGIAFNAASTGGTARKQPRDANQERLTASPRIEGEGTVA